MPPSAIASTTSGFSVPGSMPALLARKNSGQMRFSHASAICERALLWMQTKSTLVFMEVVRALCPPCAPTASARPAVTETSHTTG